MFYTVISIFFIFLMAYLVLRMAYGYIRRERKERILYLREFKKGKCIAIYLIAIPLFFIGYDYIQESGSYALFESVSRTLNSVVNIVALKFEFMSVESLMNDNAFYGVAVISCNILCFLNAGVFIVSIVQQYFWEGACHRRFSKISDNKYILVGNNSGNRRIYRSISHGKKAIVCENTQKDRNELYMEGINFFALDYKGGFLTQQLEKFAEETKMVSADNKLNIVINTGDDDVNLKYSDKLRNDIKRLFGDEPDLYQRLRIYVFASPLYEDMYYEEKYGAGCFRVINKYKIAAREFTFNYPHALDLEKWIDTKTSLIAPDISINTVFLGFGDINKNIYKHLCITDHFISEDGGRLEGHPVNYHIFDNDNAQDDISLNHDFFRYKNEFLRYDEITKKYIPVVDTSKYLPLPELSSQDIFHKMNVGSAEFYSDLKNILTGDGINVTRIIIAIGSDIKNQDIARKVLAKLKDWEIGNTKIFVYLRHKDEGRLPGDIIPFGDEKKYLYDMSVLEDSMILNFAVNRNRVYAIERAGKNGKGINENDIIRMADRNWFKEWPQSKRESNIFASLSVRGKLLMMGLDFEKKIENRKYLSYDEYMRWYAGDDIPETAMINNKKHGSVARRGLEYKASRAQNMAFQEHLRWNAYMMSRGIVPADKETILNEKDNNGKYTNGNSYEKRHHGNLTDFDGLREFAKMIVKRDGISEEQADVICYDYQILDDAWWILDEMGYGIIRIVSE